MHNDSTHEKPFWPYTPNPKKEPFFKPKVRNFAAICLDETGSMRGQEHRVVSALNEYVNQLPVDCHVSVFTFDSNHWNTYHNGYKSTWRTMTTKDYKPGAMTPLYDAVAKTIQHLEGLTKAGDKVMVMIDTDGLENSSRDCNQSQIKTMVSDKKEAGWEFLFMASGLDDFAADVVGNLGRMTGMTTHSGHYGTRSALYAAATNDTQSYFNGSDSTVKDTVN